MIPGQNDFSEVLSYYCSMSEGGVASIIFMPQQCTLPQLPLRYPGGPPPPPWLCGAVGPHGGGTPRMPAGSSTGPVVHAPCSVCVGGEGCVVSYQRQSSFLASVRCMCLKMDERNSVEWYCTSRCTHLGCKTPQLLWP